jgi:hypothetical protein
MGRRIMTSIVSLVLMIPAGASGGPPSPSEADATRAAFSGWIYRGSKPFEERHSRSQTDGVPGGISEDEGQYSTATPFHEVVRFYVEKCGVEPPNWSILGRKFPGDRINMPASWMRQMGEGKLVSLLHHIRRESASATLLVTDHDRGETLCVTITRGLQDDRTFIQLVKHTRN